MDIVEFYTDCIISLAGNSSDLTITNLSKNFGITYRIATIWKNESINGMDGWKNFIVEFLMRYDEQKQKELEKKYGLKTNSEIPIEDLSTILKIPLSKLEKFKNDGRWTGKAYEMLSRQHPRILFFQSLFVYRVCGNNFYHNFADYKKYEIENNGIADRKND